MVKRKEAYTLWLKFVLRHGDSCSSQCNLLHEFLLWKAVFFILVRIFRMVKRKEAYTLWLKFLCKSSARAIRKTALRAYCGWRHCFTHKQALNSYRCPLAKTCKHVLCFSYTLWLNFLCKSSARAIRKTALRAYCGWRHCFTHKQALNSYRCPLAKTCKHVLCFSYTVWLNFICENIIKSVVFSDLRW